MPAARAAAMNAPATSARRASARDRRAGGDPGAAGVDVGDAGVVAVEQVAEAGLEHLERRRVPAVAPEQREDARALVVRIR